MSIDFYENMTNMEAMKQAAKDFAKNSRNEGVFGGIIGVLDGWLVKIGCPSLKHDNVLNVGSFYCRKGYYALNVQAIVDRNKIIVWRSIKYRGSEHDSTAFKRSEIYRALVEKCSLLTELGLYILADSAYCLRPFLLTPYDNARQLRGDWSVLMYRYR